VGDRLFLDREKLSHQEGGHSPLFEGKGGLSALRREIGEALCLFTTGFLNGPFSAVKNQRVIAAGDPYCGWEVG